MLHLETNEDGFLAAKNYFQPSQSTADGIYLAGSITAPRDLPGTISNATMTAYEIIKTLRHH
jgi:heterodisulfide reductase subunit A-like polyferredoxin